MAVLYTKDEDRLTLELALCCPFESVVARAEGL